MGHLGPIKSSTNSIQPPDTKKNDPAQAHGVLKGRTVSSGIPHASDPLQRTIENSSKVFEDRSARGLLSHLPPEARRQHVKDISKENTEIANKTRSQEEAEAIDATIALNTELDYIDIKLNKILPGSSNSSLELENIRKEISEIKTDLNAVTLLLNKNKKLKITYLRPVKTRRRKTELYLKEIQRKLNDKSASKTIEQELNDKSVNKTTEQQIKELISEKEEIEKPIEDLKKQKQDLEENLLRKNALTKENQSEINTQRKNEVKLQERIKEKSKLINENKKTLNSMNSKEIISNIAQANQEIGHLNTDIVKDEVRLNTLKDTVREQQEIYDAQFDLVRIFEQTLPKQPLLLLSETVCVRRSEQGPQFDINNLEHISDSESELEQAKTDLEQAKTDLELSETELDICQGSLKELQQKRDHITNRLLDSEIELAEKTSKSDALIEEIDLLEKELADLIEKSSETQKTITETNNEIETLTAETKKIEEDIESCDEAITDKIVELGDTLETIDDKIKKLKGQSK